MASAAVTVSGCQPWALLNAGNSVLGSRKGNLGRVSLAWDPLLVRPAFLRVLNLSLKNDGKRRIAQCRASAGDDGEVEKINESQDDDRGFMNNLGESLKGSISSAATPAVAMFLAGGGRMGGRVFKPPPAPSRSYSGGGGGGGGGARSYNAPPIYGGSPYGYGSPFGFSPFSPFGGGYYGGGLLLGPSLGFGGGGFFLFAIVAFATLRAIAGFFRDRSGDRDDDFYD
ncbi:hypothetical protein R1sor_007007 [Riccia sorocarpa]|uniref:Glycine-rich protein n=1 Tax=Riccia sorocarpa TaxID=122646 RepID=A0ABD3HTC1_9MARC